MYSIHSVALPGIHKIGNAQTLKAFRGIMNGVVVIAASAGGLDPLRRIIAALPVPCTAAVFVVMHIGPYPSVLPHLLGGGMLLRSLRMAPRLRLGTYT